MKSLRTAVFSLAVVALGGCSSTQVVSSWRDPEVSNVTFSRVLVVAMVRDEARRRAVEDRMVADIERYGAQAVPSYRLIAAEDTRNAEVVKAAVLKGGFDGAVTWRTIAVTHETHYVPGIADGPIGYGGFWGYYDAGWSSAYEPGYLQTDRVVRVETMVYRVGSGSDRLIWAGTSETLDPNSLTGLVDGVSDATIEEMRRQQMFAPRR